MTSLTPRASIHQSSPLLLAGVMDPVASPDTQELSGDTFPHEALVLVLQRLPLDARACAACVCPAWRAATAHPLLWQELSFERCAVHINNATLASLCARAGAELRTLNLDAAACTYITCDGMVTALRGGGCTGVQRLVALPESLLHMYRCLTTEMTYLLAAACPLLQHTACSIYCKLPEVAAVSTALPGPLAVTPTCVGSSAPSMAQLVECLRTSTSITNLRLGFGRLGDEGATQLAESLRVNTTLTDLKLIRTGICAVGAMQLAECLRINTTLTNLCLSSNDVGEAGAIQFAECLRMNATLTSLHLCCNEIGDTGAIELAECLCINAALMELRLGSNCIGDTGATALAKCLRINTTLTYLALNSNRIGYAGAMQLAECLHVNATLTKLDLQGCIAIGAAGKRALKAACPPQCLLLI